MSADCLLCRIFAGELPADVVAREGGFVAIRDIAPKAPVHLLVIPEHHVASLDEVEDLTPDERSAMLVFIARVAREAGLVGSGYRVVANHGPDARQSVFHLHWHVLGGARLSDTM